jgi:hypothetical protein
MLIHKLVCKKLCRYCDAILPKAPTKAFFDLLVIARKRSWPDPRPQNPKGLAAATPMVYIDVCRRHNFETTELAQAASEGWPTEIDYEDALSRAQRIMPALDDIFLKPNLSTFYNELKEMFAKFEGEIFNASFIVYWHERTSAG